MGRGGDSFISPDLQEQAIDRLIKGQGRKGPVFKDIDRTGTTFERDGIRDALAWVMEKPESRGLAVYDVSRLGRNTSESLDTVKRLRKAGAAFASSVEQIDDSPEGDLALTMWLAMAEHYSARIGRQWRAVHEHRARRGLAHGVIPVGYRREDGHVVLDDNADEVREVFEMYAEGVRMKEVSQRLSEIRGVMTPSQNVKRTLRNPFYRGLVRHRGEYVQGEHAALVPEKVWARVQDRLNAETSQPAGRAEPRSAILSLLQCTCGSGVTLVNCGKSVVCTHHMKTLPEYRRCGGFGAPGLVKLEELLIEYLEDWCWGQHLHEPVREDRLEKRLDRVERDLEKSVEGRTRLALALARGTLTDDAYEAASEALERDIAELSSTATALRTTLQARPEDQVKDLLEITEVLRDLPPTEGRERLRRNIDRIVVHRIAPREHGIEVVMR